MNPNVPSLLAVTGIFLGLVKVTNDPELNCGCNALWVASIRVGRSVELEEVGEILVADEAKGTTLLSLKRGADCLGLFSQGYIVTDQKQLAKLPIPAILPVRVRDSRGEIVPHFVVLLAAAGDQVSVIDPPNAAQTWSYRHLRHMWDGPALSISRSDNLPDPTPPWLRFAAWFSCGVVILLLALCLRWIWGPIAKFRQPQV
jgi:ABC-type bacteriocin/lantibiotic exporter with double-glycine peptidase domain